MNAWSDEARAASAAAREASRDAARTGGKNVRAETAGIEGKLKEDGNDHHTGASNQYTRAAEHHENVTKSVPPGSNAWVMHREAADAHRYAAKVHAGTTQNCDCGCGKCGNKLRALLNSNPEGHNQYTSGGSRESRDADSHSEYADRTGERGDHLDAAKAHGKLYKQYSDMSYTLGDAGDDAGFDKYNKIAMHHADKQDHHLDAAGEVQSKRSVLGKLKGLLLGNINPKHPLHGRFMSPDDAVQGHAEGGYAGRGTAADEVERAACSNSWSEAAREAASAARGAGGGAASQHAAAKSAIAGRIGSEGAHEDAADAHVAAAAFHRGAGNAEAADAHDQAAKAHRLESFVPTKNQLRTMLMTRNAHGTHSLEGVDRDQQKAAFAHGAGGGGGGDGDSGGAALAASKAAKESGSGADHRAAAGAAKKAAMYHAERGNKAQASKYANLSKQHDKAARQTNNREEILDALTANCESAADAAALNALPDSALAVIWNARAPGSGADLTDGSDEPEMIGRQKKAGNISDENDEDWSDDTKTAAMKRAPKMALSTPAMNDMEEGEDEEEEPAMNRRTMSFDELLNNVDQETRESLLIGRDAARREKRGLVMNLLQHLPNGPERNRLGSKLSKLPKTELEERLLLVPQTRNVRSAPAPRYDGKGGGYTENFAGAVDVDDVLPILTINDLTESA